ncbi:MAG: A/G-specific adenine glycosylase [Spirochaetota bacterium]
MLQQTQVPRVIPKYQAWMEKFPDPGSLSQAPQPEVLALWSGLGYNRRALALKRACEAIVAVHQGMVPRDEGSLRSLPGIGIYTSRAVLAFAFDEPTVFLETNIRTVYIRHFFPEHEKVADSLIYPIAAACLDRDDPAKWHNALMDYGAFLKKSEKNHGAKASTYRRQSDFATSFRRVRGALLREVIKSGRCEVEALYARLPFSREDVEKGAKALAAEGFVRYEDGAVEILNP